VSPRRPTVGDWLEVKERHTHGIGGTPGFIVGRELVPGALDLKGLEDLIARTGVNP